MGERGGSIVNVTSIEGHRAGPGFAVYSAMKAAVENLTKTLALELAERRIRVNCIAPDMIPTPGDEGLSLDAGRRRTRTGRRPSCPTWATPTTVPPPSSTWPSDFARFVTGYDDPPRLAATSPAAAGSASPTAPTS